MAKVKTCSSKGVYQQIEKLDYFGSSVRFNLDGVTEIKSWPGIVVSLLLLLLMTAYSITRF
jgi:hypothetical protein